MEVTRGQQFQIEVLVDPDANGVSGGEIHLTYDPALVQVIDVTPGTLLGDNPLQGAKDINNGAGLLTYAIARVGETSVPSGAGTLAVITLRVPTTAAVGSTLLELTWVALTDESFVFIRNVNTTRGQITVR